MFSLQIKQLQLYRDNIKHQKIGNMKTKYELSKYKQNLHVRKYRRGYVNKPTLYTEWLALMYIFSCPPPLTILRMSKNVREDVREKKFTSWRESAEGHGAHTTHVTQCFFIQKFTKIQKNLSPNSWAAFANIKFHLLLSKKNWKTRKKLSCFTISYLL